MFSENGIAVLYLFPRPSFWYGILSSHKEAATAKDSGCSHDEAFEDTVLHDRINHVG